MMTIPENSCLLTVKLQKFVKFPMIIIAMKTSCDLKVKKKFLIILHFSFVISSSGRVVKLLYSL